MNRFDKIHEFKQIVANGMGYRNYDEFTSKLMKYNIQGTFQNELVEMINFLIELQKENDVLKVKIKAKLEEMMENGYWDFLEERDLKKAIDILKGFLEELK